MSDEVFNYNKLKKSTVLDEKQLEELDTRYINIGEEIAFENIDNLASQNIELYGSNMYISWGSIDNKQTEPFTEEFKNKINSIYTENKTYENSNTFNYTQYFKTIVLNDLLNSTKFSTVYQSGSNLVIDNNNPQSYIYFQTYDNNNVLKRMKISSNGLTYPDNTIQSTAFTNTLQNSYDSSVLKTTMLYYIETRPSLLIQNPNNPDFSMEFFPKSPGWFYNKLTKDDDILMASLKPITITTWGYGEPNSNTMIENGIRIDNTNTTICNSILQKCNSIEFNDGTTMTTAATSINLLKYINSRNSLQITDSTQFLEIVPKATAAFYNPICQVNDTLISSHPNPLTLTSWSLTNTNGIRIDATKTTIHKADLKKCISLEFNDGTTMTTAATNINLLKYMLDKNSLQITDSTQFLEIIPKTTGAAYNPICQINDTLITASNTLTLTSWASNINGIRIDSTKTTIHNADLKKCNQIEFLDGSIQTTATIPQIETTKLNNIYTTAPNNTPVHMPYSTIDLRNPLICQISTEPSYNQTITIKSPLYLTRTISKSVLVNTMNVINEVITGINYTIMKNTETFITGMITNATYSINIQSINATSITYLIYIGTFTITFNPAIENNTNLYSVYYNILSHTYTNNDTTVAVQTNNGFLCNNTITPYTFEPFLNLISLTGFGSNFQAFSIQYSLSIQNFNNLSGEFRTNNSISNNYLHQYKNTIYNLLPPGMIMNFAGRTTPQGWLWCDGKSYLKTTYPELHAVIGSLYRTETTTTFFVPDLRNIYVKGASTNNLDTTNALNTTYTPKIPFVNSEVGKFYESDIQQHKHSYNDSGSGTRNAATGGATTSGVASTSANTKNTITLLNNDLTIMSGVETRPHSLSMLYIIKF